MTGRMAEGTLRAPPGSRRTTSNNDRSDTTDGESRPLSSWFPRRATSGHDARRIAAAHQQELDAAKADAEELRRQLDRARADLQESNTKRQAYKGRAKELETYTKQAKEKLDQAKQQQLKDEQEKRALKKEQSELATIRDQFRKTIDEKTALEVSIRKLQSEVEDMDRKLETAENNEIELAEVRDQLEKTVGEQAALEACVRELRSELNGEKSKVDEADKELKRLREAYQELDGKNSGLSNTKQSLEQSNLELGRKNSSLATDKQALEQENGLLATTIQSLERSQRELDEKISSLAAAKETLEHSGRELDKKNSELEATNQSLKQSNDELTEQISGLQATNQSLEQSNDDLNEQNSSLVLKYESLERSQDELIKSATKEMRVLFRKQSYFIHKLLEAKARLQGEVWEFWQQNLGQKLRERDEQIEHIQKDHDETQSQLSSIQESLTIVQSENVDLKKKVGRLEASQQKAGKKARESKAEADREYSELQRKFEEAEKLAAIDIEKKAAKIKSFTLEISSLRDRNQKLYDENESEKKSVKDVDALTEERDKAIQRIESLEATNRVLSKENREQANQLIQLENTRKQLETLKGEKAAVESACAESNRQRAAIEQERDRIASEARRSTDGLESRLREECERNKHFQNGLMQFAYAQLLSCESECEQATYDRALFLDLHLRAKAQWLQHQPVVSSQLETAVQTREDSTHAFYINKEAALKADFEALSLKLQLADQDVSRLRRTFSNLRDQIFVDMKAAGNVEGTSYVQLFETFYDIVDDPRVQILKQGKIVERDKSSYDSCSLTTWSEVEEIIGRERCRMLLEFYQCIHDEHINQMKLLVDGWLLLPPTQKERQRILANGLEGAPDAEGLADMAATDDSPDATGRTLPSHVNAEAALLDSDVGSAQTQPIEVVGYEEEALLSHPNAVGEVYTSTENGAEDRHGNYEPGRAGASTLPTPEVSSPEEAPLSLPGDGARHVSRGKRAHSMDQNNAEQAAKRARNFDPVRETWSSPPRDPRRHRQPSHARAGRYDSHRLHERR